MDEDVIDKLAVIGHHGETLSIINDIIIGGVLMTIELDSSLDDQVREIGSIISRCKRLKRIRVKVLAKEKVLPASLLTALFRADGPYEFKLESLQLGGNAIGPAGLAALVPFIKPQSELRELELDCPVMAEESEGIGNEGAGLLANVLDTLPIKRLDLSNNGIGIEGLSKILLSTHGRSLTEFIFKKNHVGQVEVDELAKFLRRDGTSLESLTFGTKSSVCVKVEWVETLLRSLQNNTATTSIFFEQLSSEQDGDHKATSFNQFISIIETLVCNTASFESFCQSNHTFAKLGMIPVKNFDRHVSKSIVCEALEINARTKESRKIRLRSKLRTIFFRRTFDMSPFLSLKLSFMPNVLEFCTRSEVCMGASVRNPGSGRYFVSGEGYLNGIYLFLRCWNVPDLLMGPKRTCRLVERRNKRLASFTHCDHLNERGKPKKRCKR